MNRILPFLDSFIPASLAMKGISKIDPRLGRFLAGAVGSGYGIDKALSYLREQFQSPSTTAEKGRLQRGMQQGGLRTDEKESFQRIKQSERLPDALSQAAVVGGGLGGALASLSGMGGQQQPQEVSQQQSQQSQQSQQQSQQPQQAAQPAPRAPQQTASNVIEKYSPELAKHVGFRIYAGVPVPEVIQHAKGNSKFRKPIDQIERDSGMSFEEIVDSIYGNPIHGDQGQQATQQQIQSQQKPAGQGKIDLVNIMQKLTQRMEQLKGQK